MSGQIETVDAGVKRDEKPIKAAACLFVRNEISDIGCWLAWYHLLGFDTCIIYDDDSTDGTWEYLTAAAKVQDIRLFKSLGDRSVYHSIRQNSCYVKTLERYQGEFDWIGFFDSDEYLRLMDCSSIKEFLARFSGGAVSVNWCCYGSSGHVLKPETLPPEAYTWHSKPTSRINKHVKTLVHLPSWTRKYINLHAFDVPEGTAVDPSGTPVQWSATPGIIEGVPDWSVAKLMHYQCRSMEHYVERLKRNPKLPRNVAQWNQSNINEVEDKGPLGLIQALQEQITRYNSARLG